MKYTINDIATVISESIPNPSESGYEIFVGLEHYDSGEVKVSRYGSTANLVTAVKLFKKGDILLARRNVYLKRAGLVDFDGVTSGDSIVLRVKEDLSNLGLSSVDVQKYLPFVLNTEEFWNYAEKYSDGTMSKRLSPKTLLQYEFEIPENISEKNDLLWAAFEAKESYRKMIAATDEMVKSQFIEDYYNRYEPTNLGAHISVIRGVSYKPADIRGTGDEAVAILRSNNISDGEINYEDIVYVSPTCVSEKQFVDSGDIVMCGSNGSKKLVGKAGMVAGKRSSTSFGAFCLGIRCKETLAPEYLNAYFNSRMYRSIIEELGNGTNIINIRPDHITSLSIPIPEKTVQNVFVVLSRQADKSKFELKQAIEKIDKVMRALMQ